ncbi:putative acetyltransferase [Brachybacterium sp. AOP25-B2-12]|uniref:putative acetyltransferase n=1 Tax=Brachybacterium sp. AOP25-B2-12 TaxID=3457710 RepID=UPI00403380CE
MDARDEVAGPSPARERPGWAPFLEPGVRVVLRYRIDRALSPHGEGMTDALGTIAAVDAETVTVMTRRGADRVVRGLVIAAKQVPPAPVRRVAPR